MNIGIIVWSYFKSKPLQTFLNILLLGLGVAVIVILLLFDKQFENQIEQNTRGIDLVVGAKGSPMQLILCNVFHVDFPTGNIRLYEAERIAKNRLIKKAIPLALGDSYQGFRIVGTSQAFISLYQGEVEVGETWDHPMEVVLGHQVAQALKLKPGDNFSSIHGLTQGGQAHGEEAFIVKGILKPSSRVLDKLILTSVESIWHVHGEHVDKESPDITLSLPKNPSSLIPSASLSDSSREITSLLMQFRSPLATIQLPRMVNSQTHLQAASPAFEVARLNTMLGFGAGILKGFAFVLIGISAISIFLALYNSLKERRYDMALMRSMGASRIQLLLTLVLEGMFLTFFGCLFGLVLGHGSLILGELFMDALARSGVHGYVFYPQEWIILGWSLLLGLLTALIPGWEAYKSDISKILSGNV